MNRRRPWYATRWNRVDGHSRNVEHDRGESSGSAALAARRAGYRGLNRWTVKCLETRSSRSQKRPERGQKCWRRVRAVFLCIAHVLGMGGLDNSSISEGATVHSLGASAPGSGDTSKEALFQPRRGDSRAVAEPYCRPVWGLERGKAGAAWGHPGADASRLFRHFLVEVPRRREPCYAYPAFVVSRSTGGPPCQAGPPKLRSPNVSKKSFADLATPSRRLRGSANAPRSSSLPSRAPTIKTSPVTSVWKGTRSAV